jgi:hypothetical protein
MKIKLLNYLQRRKQLLSLFGLIVQLGQLEDAIVVDDLNTLLVRLLVNRVGDHALGKRLERRGEQGWSESSKRRC